MKTGFILLLWIAIGALAQTNPAPSTTTVNGSVFIVLKDATNIKLALAPVYVISEPRFNEISEKLKPEIDREIKQLASRYFRAELANNGRAQLELLESLNNFVERTYFDAFPEKAALSDADGKFTLTFHTIQKQIIACRSERELLGGKSERFFWAFKFQPTGQAEQIMFSNNNLTKEHNIFERRTLQFFDEVEILKEERDTLIRNEYARRIEQQRVAQAAKVSKAQTKALEFNLKQAENGDAYGQYRMGVRYLKGEGVSVDEAKGIEWLKKAIAQGHADAKKALDDYHLLKK